MHVRCDKQYQTGADRENILGQPMLFECMGICVLSRAHESEKQAKNVDFHTAENIQIQATLFHYF